MREPEPLQQVDRTYVLHRGRKLSYFAGCDYFRLSSCPDLVAAFNTAALNCGLNVAASRLTTGNHTLYSKLEHKLASFFGAGDALVVPTGYVANLIVAQALASQFSHAFIDERSHASLKDAAQMLDCPVLEFRHASPADLERCFRRVGAAVRAVVLTDGMFSNDGSVAPLREYVRLLPEDSVLLVDDAHGAGVLGKHGRGTLEFCRVGRRRVIQTVTLSKAFGAYGGAILATKKVRRLVLSRSRLFTGSTPLPPPLAAAAIAGIARMSAGALARKGLASNVSYVRAGLRSAGLEFPNHPGPIIAIEPRSLEQVSAIRSALLSRHIYPSFIKYWGGPAAGYYRFVISSQHGIPQLDALIGALIDALKD